MIFAIEKIFELNTFFLFSSFKLVETTGSPSARYSFNLQG